MIIKNAQVYTEGFAFEKRDVAVEGELFAETAGGGTVDASGLLMLPGLIDIHSHGCDGYDFCDGTDEALDAITAYEGKNGVTAISPASMTLAEETLAAIYQNAARYSYRGGAMFLGVNMEGPFFNPAKKGAQNGAFLREPDIGMFRRLWEASGGRIKTACVAPELPGAMEFIDEAKRYCAVAVAHTTSDYDTAMEAFRRGVSRAIHLYNAMPPFSHRAPGVVGAVADSGAMAELICDGVHIHPAVVRATVKLLGDDKVVLISDSMMATGLSDGAYSLGGQHVDVKGNLATLSDGTIAGSATNLFDCMRCAVKFGVPLESAVRMATINPAKAIGEDGRMGSIASGKLANFVLADRELNIRAVYVKGKQL